MDAEGSGDDGNFHYRRVHVYHIDDSSELFFKEGWTWAFPLVDRQQYTVLRR